MHHVELNSGTSKSSKLKSFYMFEDIDLRESHTRLHKNPSETLGGDSIKRLEISIYRLPQHFN